MKKEHIFVGLGLAALILYVMRQRPDLARTAGEAAGRLVGEAATGAVLGIGDVIGIPRTSAEQCQADWDAGRAGEATFSCSVPDLVRVMTGNRVAWRGEEYDRDASSGEIDVTPGGQVIDIDPQTGNISDVRGA